MKIPERASVIKQKRTWLIVAVVLVVIIAGVAILSDLRYANVSKSLNNDYRRAKQSAQAIVPDSKAGREDRLKAVNELSIQVTVKCQGEWWNAWYGVLIPSAQERVKDCMAKTIKLRAISQAANRLQEYLKDDDKVSKTLEVLKIATGSNDWQKTALASAESTRRDLEKIAVTKDNKVLLATSKEKVSAIIAKWNALNTAASKQDKTAYLQAQTELAGSYADLGAISDVSDAQVEKLVGALYAKSSML